MPTLRANGIDTRYEFLGEGLPAGSRAGPVYPLVLTPWNDRWPVKVPAFA